MVSNPEFSMYSNSVLVIWHKMKHLKLSANISDRYKRAVETTLYSHIWTTGHSAYLLQFKKIQKPLKINFQVFLLYKARPILASV